MDLIVSMQNENILVFLAVLNAKYKAYLLSDEWLQVKLDLLQSRGCVCQKCKKPKPPNKLQVHHKTYERIFNELPSDLMLLCAKCHMKKHKDIIPKSTLEKFGIVKNRNKKTVSKKKVKNKHETKIPKKKKLTVYQKALAYFSNK